MILDELLRGAQPLRDRIRTSARPYADAVELRLDVSARHLSTVALGRELEPIWHRDNQALRRQLPTDSATVITAAQTLVFGGAQCCLDLCASAVMHWHGVPQPKADRDFDLGHLKSKKLRDLGVTLEQWAIDWRDETTGHGDYAHLDRYRGAQMHRIVRRSATVAVGDPTGGGSWLSPNAAGDPADPVDDAYRRVLDFTTRTWWDFWKALAASTPK